MTWDLSCPDWEDRIRTGRSLLPELPKLNKGLADQAVAVFNRLRLTDVPGNPTLADAAGDWFRDIVRALHGSWDAAAKERYIREIFALVAKKNSKTSYSAGLMLTSLILNERPKGKFLLVAPTQDITVLAFDQCQGMVQLDPYLSKRMKVQQHLKTITDTTNGSTLEVMSFDPNVLTGQKPTGFLVDELHVVSSSAKANSAVGQLRGGMIAQPEAFGIFITTQSEKPPTGVFKSELDVARSIRDGKSKGRTLPILYEFPPDIAKDKEAWKDARNWFMVTPNRGRSITVDRLKEEFVNAQERGDAEIIRWATQHLNIEAGISLASDRWAGADFWMDQIDPTLTLESLIERSEVIVAGVDGGGLDDLLALAVIGRDKITRDYLHWGKAWAQPVLLRRHKQIEGRLRDFEAMGQLRIVDKAGTDTKEIADQIAELDATGLLYGVGLDPIGIGAIIDALAERGIVGKDRVIGVSQGHSFSKHIKTVERKLAEGTFWHCGQEMLAWAAGNAKVELKGSNLYITKQNSGSAKVDPLFALLDAACLMSGDPPVPEEKGSMEKYLENPMIW